MKKVLVIGATGCMGSHLVPMLLKKGYQVDGVTMDNAVSDNENLRYIQVNAQDEKVLSDLLKNGYHGIIDFLHYADIENFKKKAKLFLENTEHYIFLSSYRAYADSEQAITEKSLRLTEAYPDHQDLMENDFYGVKKCLGEDVLNNSGYKNYTIVRPVVVYGENRYPITTWANNVVAHRAQNNKPLLLPLGSKDKGASLIYAGDIAKLFCGLLFNEKAFGESYTFGSPENLTWEDTAKICEKVMNLKSIWIETEDFAKVISGNSETVPVAVRFMLYYDRLFNRSVCVDKALNDAGLTKDDFLTFEQGLKKCYAVFPKNYQPQHYEQSFIDYMDEYLKIRGKK